MDKKKKMIYFHNSEIRFYLNFGVEELINVKVYLVPYATMYWT